MIMYCIALALVNFAVLKLLMFAEAYYLFSVRFETCKKRWINMVLSIKRRNQNARDLNSDHFRWAACTTF